MKPPLLYLCHRIPYPPNKGDKIRSFHMLQFLSRHFEVYLGTFVDDQDDWRWVPEVEKLCADSIFLPLNPLTAKAKSLGGLMKAQVLSLAYYDSPRLHAWVRERVEERQIDRALVFSAAMAPFALALREQFDRLLVDLVDVDSDKWLQYAQRKVWPLSWLYRREGKLLLAYERDAVARSDAALLVSEPEAALFRRLAPESADKVFHVNNGVDLAYFSPQSGRPNPYAGGERVLVFTGAMDYWPNIDAVSWFAREIFPALSARDEALRFVIVGSNPTPAVKRLANQDTIEVTGRVEDVRGYIQHAAAVVAPMRVARGVQNKVLEGMAMARPVLVSPRGLEGIHACDGEQVLLADSPREYLDRLGEILAGRHDNLGDTARDWVEAQFSWDRNLSQVVRLLEAARAPGAVTSALG